MGALLISYAIEKDQGGEIADIHKMSRDQFNQIRKYLLLLAGKEERDGISFMMIAECLEIDTKTLHEIYDLVEAIRGVPEPPTGYEWKLVKKKEVQFD